MQQPPTVRLTVERMTQTENRLPKWRQFLYCLKGDDKFRRQRQREAASNIYYYNYMSEKTNNFNQSYNNIYLIFVSSIL